VSLSLLRLLPALLVLTLPISPPAHADTLVGKVVRILDGDTVEVLDARKRTHRVRLAGIDLGGRDIFSVVFVA
jgi:endonuclease YncB( thermonuclease family)